MDDSVAIVIQARMTSTRLPEKVLLNLFEDKEVLQVMVDRLSAYRKNIILALPKDETSEPLIEFANRNNLKYYLGDMDDVLSRYYEAVKNSEVKIETIVRLTSDCPLMDASILKNVLSYFQTNSFDYCSNTINRTMPRGMDIEIFTFEALEKAYKMASKAEDREHVTRYIYVNRELFTLGSYEDKVDNSAYRITIDEPNDYEAIKLLLCKIGRVDFSYTELINTLEANSDIVKINQEVVQKTT